jgi:hypothetical protein
VAQATVFISRSLRDESCLRGFVDSADDGGRSLDWLGYKKEAESKDRFGLVFLLPTYYLRPFYTAGASGVSGALGGT